MAFDKELHGRLVWKLRSHMIQSEQHYLIQSWLKGGKRGDISGLDWRPVENGATTGIGAGSTVIHYINNVNVSISGMVSKYIW